MNIDLALSKMKAKHFWGVVLGAFLSLLLVEIPNYQKFAYKDTEPIEYSSHMEDEYLGYPAGENFPVIESKAETESGDSKYFTMEQDVSVLQPLDLYLGLEEGTYRHNGFIRSIDNNLEGGVARFFTTKLESGESVIILLDDTTIDLPKKGVVRLPIGRYQKAREAFKEVLREESGLSDVDGYIDMASGWRKGEESEKLENKRSMALLVVFLGLFFLISGLFGRYVDKE